MILRLLTKSHLEWLSLKEAAQACLVYTCQNATLMEITWHGSIIHFIKGCLLCLDQDQVRQNILPDLDLNWLTLMEHLKVSLLAEY